MKKHLIVYYGDAPECVEGFKEKECERSCKGSLHVNPGRQLTVTDDELEFLKKNYKHMLPKLRILSTIGNEVEKKANAKPKKEAKAEESAKPKNEEAQEEGKPKKAKKNRR
jgi:heterodisulfide reductase subunit B